MIILIVVAFTVSTFLSTDSIIAVKNRNSLQAFYIASSGMEYYLNELERDSDWSSPPTTESHEFGGGLFTITTTNEQKNSITFTITGLFTFEGETYQRAVRPTIQRTAGGLGDILAEYVLYWGEGSGGDGSFIDNNATIIGNMYTGSTLEIGTNVNVSGDVESIDDVIVGAGSTIEGELQTGVEPPYGQPSLETSWYDSQIAIAATYPSGNQSWDSQAISGTTYINGDLTMKNNANITVTGVATIIVTGNISLQLNVIVGDNLTVIAGGAINISNNVDIGLDGLWYSSVSIDVGNNAEVSDVNVGQGTIFITPGDVTFGNNIEFYGFLYAGGDFVQTGNNFYFEGNMIIGGDINVDENTTLVLNPDLVSAEDLIGIGEGMEGVETIDVTSWDEVY